MGAGLRAGYTKRYMAESDHRGFRASNSYWKAMRAREGRWFPWSSLIPLWAALGFSVLFWLMDAIDPSWGPNDLWLHMFFWPVLPLSFLFQHLSGFLITHHYDFGHPSYFYAVMMFGTFCYAFSASLYMATWRLINGPRSTRLSIPFILTGILFLAQYLLRFQPHYIIDS